jgi:glycosyltransferase involved in cell wall biosynthesis
MKIAIVHDELMRRGGAEQVVRCFHQAFPEAPLYTMAYRPELTYPDFKNCRISTSWYNRFTRNEEIMRKLFFPFGVWAMKQLKIEDYDIILMSSTYAAKYANIDKKTLVINYCHTPFRLAWYPESYSQYVGSKGLVRLAYDFVIGQLRKIDFRSAQRSDIFIANTAEVGNRIKTVYRHSKHIEVIKPPVNCMKFYVSEKPKDYYLVVSRLESYKKIDLIVETFNELGYPLVIVGKGSMEEKLKKMAGPNIKFFSGLSSEELAALYSECKAFIFPQKEDYGITPLEANASGRPVIAFGEGGVLDTMIPYSGDASRATALFFKDQTREALIEAIKKFQTLEFSPEFIRTHAEKFDEIKFIEKIRSFVKEKYEEKYFPNKEKGQESKYMKVKIA